MKKILAAVLAVVMMMALVGCSSDTEKRPVKKKS